MLNKAKLTQFIQHQLNDAKRIFKTTGTVTKTGFPDLEDMTEVVVLQGNGKAVRCAGAAGGAAAKPTPESCAPAGPEAPGGR